MLMSKLLGDRYKEKSSDANLISHIYLIRGGYVRQVSNGIFSMLNPAKRIASKIENIIREEMNKIDGQEVLFPVVLPARLWEETGRYSSVGSELIRFQDRAKHRFLMAMTHEEAAVHLARTEAKTYIKYPFMMYQIQTKFRDEPRSRGCLIRVREFTMKDAYSFHTSLEDLEQYYYKVHESYERIYNRIGFKNIISVASDTGMMGGKIAHEFMFLSKIGEDSLVFCDNCGYKANMEVAVSAGNENNSLNDNEGRLNTYNYKREVFFESEVEYCLGYVKKTKRFVIIFFKLGIHINETKIEDIIGDDIELDFNLGFSRLLEIYGEHEETCHQITTTLEAIKQHLEDNLYNYNSYFYSLENENIEILLDQSMKHVLSTNSKYKRHYHQDKTVQRDEYFNLATVLKGDKCAKCDNGKLTIKRGVEVGNIFQLGDKYTSDMNMEYVDVDGTKKTPVMGCYGIGIGRTLACVIEDSHDDRGPIWPISIAPWHIQICMINTNLEEVLNVGMDLYNKLKTKHEVLIDDRNLAAGVQFAEADLLGIPVRIVVSSRNLENKEIEISTRDKKINIKVLINEVEITVDKIVSDLKSIYK